MYARHMVTLMHKLILTFIYYYIYKYLLKFMLILHEGIGVRVGGSILNINMNIITYSVIFGG